MRKILLLIFAAAGSFYFSACEEDLNINGDFRQKFVLNSILKGDTNFQIVNLSKSFEIHGFDPYSNKDDQSIYGAEVRIWVEDKIYELKDTIIERNDTSIYKFPVHFYYHPNLTFKSDQDISIEAVLPQGKILKSRTRAPSNIDFTVNTTRIIPPESGNKVVFEWIPKYEHEDRIYTPRLYLNYYRQENGNLVYYSKNVPMDYIFVNGKEKEYYSLPSYNGKLEISMNTVGHFLSDILEPGTNKSDYKIAGARLDVVIYDKNLTGYYVATNFLDDLSIRIDAIDFSNIEGGLGVFGSYVIKSIDLGFDYQYLKEFGYQPY